MYLIARVKDGNSGKCCRRRRLLQLEDSTNSVIAGISHVDVAPVVHGHVRWIPDAGRGGWTCVAGKVEGAVAHDRADQAVWRNAAHPLVEAVGNDEVAFSVLPQPAGESKPTGRSQIAISCPADDAVAGKGGDGDTVAVADTMITCVGDKDFAGVVDENSGGEVELCFGRGTVVAGKTGGSSAGNRRDDPGGGDPPNRVIAAVGHEDYSGTVHVEGGGQVEVRRGCRSAVAGECRGARSSHGGYFTAGVNRANAVILRIRYVHDAIGIDENTRRTVQAGVRRGGAVTREASATVAGDCGNVAGNVDAADPVVIGVGNVNGT